MQFTPLPPALQPPSSMFTDRNRDTQQIRGTSWSSQNLQMEFKPEGLDIWVILFCSLLLINHQEGPTEPEDPSEIQGMIPSGFCLHLIGSEF